MDADSNHMVIKEVVHKLHSQDKVDRWSKNVHFLSTQGEGSRLKNCQNIVNVVCEWPQRRINDIKDPRTLEGQKILNAH